MRFFPAEKKPFACFALGCAMLGHEALSRETDIDLKTSRLHTRRELRAFTLPNQLEVLLISDKDAKKSAAALDVRVGTHADPAETPGLAHFVEHLLFLGTKKYPEVDGYSQYLKNNQGFSNAYTAYEDTNYFFEVNHQAFDEALDRFGQFFVEPLFDPAYIKREVNAVHSEHQKNLQDDGWRLHRLLNILQKKGHPRTNFGTGNLETLASVGRKEAIAFYEKHYSANRMKLVVVSNKKLDELQSLVTKVFSNVPNRKLPPNVYSADFYQPEKLPVKVSVVPVTDKREISLDFPIPSTHASWKGKPTHVLSHLIGHEGEGSLLSLLKKEDLAVSLSSGAMTYTYGGFFSINIEPTEKGLKQQEKILELVFAYIRLLRDKPLPDYVFSELETLSQVAYVNASQEYGGNVASQYAMLMQRYPAADIDYRNRLLHSLDPKEYRSFLDALRVDRMTYTLVDKSVKPTLTEEYYGTRYHLEPLPKAWVKTLQSVPLNKELTYPEANPYIPTNLSLLSAGKDADKADPVQILPSEQGEFWFQQDQTFKIAKGRVSLRILSPTISGTAKERLMSLLYVEALNESINEWSYQAATAGISVEVMVNDDAIHMRIGGYSQFIPKFLQDLFGKLRTITISEAHYVSLRQAIERDFKSTDFEAAYRKALYELRHDLDPGSVHRDLYKDLIASISLEEVKAFVPKIYERTALLGAAYGNFRKADFVELFEGFHKSFKPKAIPRKDWPLPETIPFKAGMAEGRVVETPTNNFAWAQAALLSNRNAESEAMMELAQAFGGQSFYTSLRTEQQLGYIVAMQKFDTWQSAGMLWVIQSSEFDVGTIAERAAAWRAQTVKDVDALKPELYADLQKAIIEEWSQPASDMQERLNDIFMEAIVRGGQFAFKDKVIDAVKKMDLKSFKQSYKDLMTLSDARTRAIYVSTEGSKPVKVLERAAAE